MSSIAVVGAGPAGLTAAMELVKLGHDVVVFEKTDVVGGKCHNLVHEGKTYDLGANLVTDRYTMVRPLAEAGDLGFYMFPSMQMIDLETGSEPAMTKLSALHKFVIRAFSEWYIFVRDRSGVDQEGYAGLSASVRAPFGDWLRGKGLGGMREAFATYFIAYGYGVMDELPAAYAMKFLDAIHFRSSIDIALGSRTPTMQLVEGGYQAIWEGVVARHELDVRLGADVRKVDRSGENVTITFAQDGSEQTATFDSIILGCPLDAALSFLDATPQETRLFSQIEYYDYYATAVELEGVPRVATFLHPYSKHLHPGEPTVFYAPLAAQEDDVFMFYAYGGDGVGESEVRANIERVVTGAPFHGKLREWITTKHWRYFPHVSSEVMRAGFFDEIDAMQGQRNTWYTGEVLSFPLVELAARFSTDLVTRNFGAASPAAE